MNTLRLSLFRELAILNLFNVHTHDTSAHLVGRIDSINPFLFNTLMPATISYDTGLHISPVWSADSHGAI